MWVRFALFSFLVLVLLGGTAGSAMAQTSAPGPGAPVELSAMHIPRVSRPPKLDDFLTGAAREAETTVSDFRQAQPGDGIPASQATTAHLSYDDKNLYVVFVCRDDPVRIRARLAKREDIFSDDRVAIYLDTFHDTRRRYRFHANPLGIQWDAIETEGQGTDNSFDTLWHSEGRLTSDGYVVWMAIPFRSLRFPDAPRQTWGVALARYIPRHDELVFWPYITLRINSFGQQFATMEGLEGISPGRNLQFIPYGIFSQARFLDRSIPEFRSETDGRAGLDAKIVLRDSFTLDVAINPDFSQVESDEPQVTVNQRFEVFFPEKRPLFIENASFFVTPINLFFSRRIADPQFGARLTGKSGPWALAGLVIDDRSPGRRVPPGDPLRGDRAAIGVIRVQREIGKQSSLGLFVSSTDFASSSNRVFALDTRVRLNPNWTLTGQAARSYDRALSGARRAGPTYYAEVSHSGRHFAYVGRYNDRSPDLRVPLGFIPRTDIRQTEQFVSYTWRPEKGRVLSFGPDAFAVVNWDRTGRLQDWFVEMEFNAFLRGPSDMGCERTEAFEVFQGRGFRRHFLQCGFSTAWLKWLEMRVTYGQGTRVNFFPGPGQLPFLANANRVDAGFTVRPSPRLRFDQSYLFTRLGTREASTPVGFTPEAAIFNNHILRSKLNYQFTRELSLRAIVDYNSVLANPQLIRLEYSKQVTADLLLTYLVNPGTAVYVGYTDRYENLDVAIGPPPSLVRTGAPNISGGRQFFVKLSYLFRY